MRKILSIVKSFKRWNLALGRMYRLKRAIIRRINIWHIKYKREKAKKFNYALSLLLMISDTILKTAKESKSCQTKCIYRFDKGESCKSPGVNLNQSLGHIKKKRKKSNNKRRLNFSALEIV